MNSSGVMSRLGVKVTAIAFLALAVTFWIFLLIYEVVLPGFLYNERLDEYWSKKETIAFEDFQAYVTEKELTMRAAIQDADWEKSHHTVNSYLEKYDPESVELYGAEVYAEHEIRNALIPALVYALVIILLNLCRVVEGPYPFLMVYAQPWYASVLWCALILGIAALLAWGVLTLHNYLVRKVIDG